MVKSEASYLVAPGAAEYHEGVSKLVDQIAQTLSHEFGAFLIVEVWSAPEGGQANDPSVPTVLPTFTIRAPKTAKMTRTAEALAKRLRKIKVLKHGVEVELVRGGNAGPPMLPRLIAPARASELNCWFLGIAVPPVFRKANTGDQFPLVIRSLRRSLSLAMRQAYFEFARARTTHSPPHYHTLGRKAVVRAVWDVDRQLADVSNQFDYLLQLTPVNANSAWKEFEEGGFKQPPEFHYRPLPIDPTVLKSQLFKIPIERVEDPALQRLFQEKQEELELKLTMLRDRDTPRFLYESLTLFGSVRDGVLTLAEELLRKLPSNPPSGDLLFDAAEFSTQVQAEIDHYREISPVFKAKVQVSDDVSGLIVSRGKLMINSDLKLSRSRVDALLAHEVGTHLVTYFNGRHQPFQQLYSGLAGYEELQEGLAVLSEYLVGGLSTSRLRQLAARVVAVRMMSNGASFVDTFQTLHNDCKFTPRSSYNIAMRVFRGGGLTKDAVYLRGLVAILQYVSKGGDLAPLLVGKMAVKHIPIIKELQYRDVLKPVPITPRYMTNPDSVDRLERLRGGTGSVFDLVAENATRQNDA
ncbi:flavohemoglobin expression-modulating QEGLA motif protein [Novipirellula artificiosorum]|uniref:flavohemoglobin expression-modulating QEGLA motif protein n=1 Tax=Novipirellula artificiosorum TaxID=2528016 RepID=UPI0011B5222E|nr:flavohemoglobin expression-modulating QEGLA motif protein [Novipirellula artificiosorum]